MPPLGFQILQSEFHFGTFSFFQLFIQLYSSFVPLCLHSFLWICHLFIPRILVRLKDVKIFHFPNITFSLLFDCMWIAVPSKTIPYTSQTLVRIYIYNNECCKSAQQDKAAIIFPRMHNSFDYDEDDSDAMRSENACVQQVSI